MPSLQKNVKQSFLKDTCTVYGKPSHWRYDGSDYARLRCEQIIELYEETTLPKIKKDVLEELGKVAQQITVNSKAFMETLKQEIEYFKSSGEFDDYTAYQKELREIMGYVEHFIEEQKGLLVEEGEK